MGIDSSIIETGFDRLVGIVRENGKISLNDAAKQLKVSEDVVRGWADYLAEDGTISVDYRLAKPYLIDRKTFDKESFSVLAKAFNEFIDGISNEISEESIKKKWASSFAAFRKKIDSEKEIKTFLSSCSGFLAPLAEKAINEMGHSRAEKIFENAYSKVNEKYSNNPAVGQILNIVPRGMLEAERFDMLTKEEIKKVAKELKNIEVMKSDFTNIAAHELRTPLVPIIGFLDRLLKNPSKFKLTKEVQDNLEICLRNARKLNMMVEDMLSISKLESGAMKFEMKAVDIGKLISSLKSDFLEAAKKKKLSLMVKVPDKLPNAVGDGQRISQVLSNLVQNAIKFTDKGPITISAVQKNGKIICGVEDRGIGIDKGEIPRLFDKYYQVASSAKRQLGTGLGLAICKEIIQKHNGRMWVESQVGKGSSFYFTLPIKAGRSSK